MSRTLHITNGDVVAGRLQELVGTEDMVLAWRDIFIDGPLQTDYTDVAFLQERGAYFEQTMGVPQALFVTSCLEQHQVLGQWEAYDQIVLWFEQDLFDQTMLIYLLYWFSCQKRPSADLGPVTLLSHETDRGLVSSLSTNPLLGKLQLLSINSFPGIEPFYGLGQLSTAQLRTLWETWQPVSVEQLALGHSAWQAYSNSEEKVMHQLMQTVDINRLPLLKPALELHLQRFPSAGDGLGLVERQTLALVRREGQIKLMPLFQAISKLNVNYGLGDLQYWSYLERMRSGPAPLLYIDGPKQLPNYDSSEVDWEAWSVQLTAEGELVLQGVANAIALNGIERWLGGVHLQRSS